MTCTSHVDQHPIRASIHVRLEYSAHTGAAKRMEKVQSIPVRAQESLTSLDVSTTSVCLPITTEGHLDLINWTARLTRADRHGSANATESPRLGKRGLSESQWHQQKLGTESNFGRVFESWIVFFLLPSRPFSSLANTEPVFRRQMARVGTRPMLPCDRSSPQVP